MELTYPSVVSPTSLYSLALMKSLTFPTSELGDLPSVISEQIKLLKDAPGSYMPVETTVTFKKVGDNQDEYMSSVEELKSILENFGFNGDETFRVIPQFNLQALWIGSDLYEETFDSPPVFKYDFNGDDVEFIDKGGSIIAKFSVKNLNEGMCFWNQIKITFKENKMNISLTTWNEHIVGQYTGKFSKV